MIAGEQGQTAGTPTGYTGSDLAELRTQAFRAVLLAAAAVAVGWQAFGTVAVRPGTWIAPLGLLAACVTALWVQRRSFDLAAWVLVAGLLSANLAAVWFHPAGPATTFLALVVLAAAALLGHRQGFFVGAVISLALAVIARRFTGALPGELLAASLFLVWGGAFLAWLAGRPLRTALDWAWSSYAQVLQRTEELRDRQGELNRALKSLNEAYARLERANEELDRARRAAAEARRLKAEFAANISHELRTPLNLIIGFSEVMTISPQSYSGQALPPAYRNDVEAIYRNACHLSSLIDDVLELSEIDARRMGLRREDASLNSIVEEAVASVRGLFDTRGLGLCTDAPPSLPRLHVDPTRVRQILINLLSNAARFTDRGSVRITATCEEGREVVVAVADTGLGIDPAELPHVFDEFWHFRQAGGRGGTGLGLTISKRFAEMHGGSMWVTSRPGEGTTFFVSLPVSDNVAADLPGRPWETWVRLPGGTGKASPTVLVLDEERAAGNLFARHLDGYRVVTARSRREARRLAGQCSPDAVILATAAGTAAAAPPPLEGAADLPVVACAVSGSRATAHALGVFEYLVKPVTRERLRGALARLGEDARDVLVIDDDPEMVRLLSRLIRSVSRRYRVWEATHGAAGLALMRERRPDAVVLDLLMAGLDGYAVLEQMRADDRLRPIPVIVVTAKGRGEETVTASSVAISRPGGLPVGVLMSCLKASLDAVLDARDSSRGQSAASAV